MLVEVESYAMKHWNHVTEPKVLHHNRGWFFFRFANDVDRYYIRGVAWRIGGKYILLNQWTTAFCIEI